MSIKRFKYGRCAYKNTGSSHLVSAPHLENMLQIILKCKFQKFQKKNFNANIYHFTFSNRICLLLVPIDDLEINNAGNIWKYVDDTTTSEIVVKGASSNSQLIADTVVQWSFENRVKLNSEKCKELRISFPRTNHNSRL